MRLILDGKQMFANIKRIMQIMVPIAMFNLLKKLYLLLKPCQKQKMMILLNKLLMKENNHKPLNLE